MIIIEPIPSIWMMEDMTEAAFHSLTLKRFEDLKVGQKKVV